MKDQMLQNNDIPSLGLAAPTLSAPSQNRVALREFYFAPQSGFYYRIGSVESKESKKFAPYMTDNFEDLLFSSYFKF